MKKSKHAKRMERANSRRAVSKLNLVSLMDIFTILVFFLLVNSSDVEVLQNNKDIELPESVAEQKPAEQLVVTVTKESILVKGREVASLANLDGSSDIQGLMDELKREASRSPYANEEAEKLGRNVSIMADKDTPYTLLKKVMATCAKSEYRNISLAVSQVPNEAEPIVVGESDSVEG
jgi:biopolymer transport protein ExbD